MYLGLLCRRHTLAAITTLQWYLGFLLHMLYFWFHNLLNTLFFPSSYTFGARRIMIDDSVHFCILCITCELQYQLSAIYLVCPCPMHSPFHFNQALPVSEWYLLVSYCVKVNCRDNPQNQTPMLQLLGQRCIWAINPIYFWKVTEIQVMAMLLLTLKI